jgi:MFS family permease
MAVNTNLYLFFAIFFLYGIYAAATEGISKAWISNITDKKDTATAIGTYTAFQSICTMLASSLTGLLWLKFNATVAFTITAVVTLIIVIYFVVIPKQ